MNQTHTLLIVLGSLTLLLFMILFGRVGVMIDILIAISVYVVMLSQNPENPKTLNKPSGGNARGNTTQFYRASQQSSKKSAIYRQPEGSEYQHRSYTSGFPNGNVPRRRGSPDYEWQVGAIVSAGFHKNCMVMEIHDNPLHYYLHTSRGNKITFFPHHGIHSGWVDYY